MLKTTFYDERSSLAKRFRNVTAFCIAALLLLLFSYLHYFGDYSNTVVYFVLPQQMYNKNTVQSQDDDGTASSSHVSWTMAPLIFVDSSSSNNNESVEANTSVDFDSSTADQTTSPISGAAMSTNVTNVFFESTITLKAKQCFIPKLVVDDISLQHLMKHYSKLVCSPMKNWVYTAEGRFFIDEAAVKKYGPISCDYINIQRIDEYNFKETIYANYPNGSQLLADAFRVQCRTKGTIRAKYTNVHVGIPLLDKYKQTADPSINNSQPHVLIYLLDSMSRINFIRKLPNFYKVLTDKMGVNIMEGFNVVGDGTPWAVIPMTTGHYQTELPEARKRFSNSSFLDDWPFIFKDYQKAGFATSYVEEQPLFSAFTYKLKGFDKPPVDHYLRTMLLAADKRKREHKDYCLGDTPKSLVWLKYWREMRNFYEQRNRPTFSFLFSAETSHDDYNLVQVLDEHLAAEFEDLSKKGYLNNTFVLVMGDHGRRFGPVRQTQSGKLEEKLPFLGIATPSWFKDKYPKKYANLKTNADRLMTVFDLHSTLKNILHLDIDFPSAVDGKLQRGLSLFDEVPVWRSCEDASIKPHFCSCLKWTDVERPEEDFIVRNGTQLVIDRFNSLVAEAKGQCAQLTVGKIISARSFVPNDDLMAFKESHDYDNYFPDLSANKNVSSFVYQIRFTTKPADADFEASLTYFADYGRFVFNDDDVSRLNMYGDQPKCIINTFHHLRQFCYCV